MFGQWGVNRDDITGLKQHLQWLVRELGVVGVGTAGRVVADSCTEGFGDTGDLYTDRTQPDDPPLFPCKFPKRVTHIGKDA